MKPVPKPVKNPELLQLSRWSEYRRGVAKSAGPAPKGCLAARGSVGVFDYRAGDYEPVAFGYPQHWNLIKAQLRHVLIRMITFRLITPATNDVTYKRVGGVDETVRASDSNQGNLFNSGGAVARFRYGSNAQAESQDDFHLITPIGLSIDANVWAYDNSLFTATGDGSRVHAEAGDTIREIEHTQQWVNTAGVASEYMLDRQVTTSTPVATGQTVAVQYVWSWSFP